MANPIETIRAYHELHKLNSGEQFNPELVAKAGLVGQTVISGIMQEMADQAKQKAEGSNLSVAPGSYVYLGFGGGTYTKNSLSINTGLALVSQIHKGNDLKGQLRIGYELAEDKDTDYRLKLTYMRDGNLSDANLDVLKRAPIVDLRRALISDYFEALNDTTAFHERSVKEAIDTSGLEVAFVQEPTAQST